MKYYMNKMMVDITRKTPYKKVTISKRLYDILDEGLIVKNDCVFLRCFYEANHSHLTEYMFKDKTQYEHAMNDFHFDFFCSKCTINHVLTFVNRFEKMIRSYNIENKFFVVISFDKEDVSFSFNGIHKGEPLWIEPQDIDDYKQPLLLVEL